MAVNLSPYGGVGAQFFSNNGVPLAGGKIFTYAAGTTTPQATYTSASGVTAHANPIILDAAGRVPGGEIWLTDGLQYKFVLKDANDITLATYDNVVGINSNFINYTNEQEIQTATSGQTVFTLTTMQYQPGTGSLSVFVDGVNQYGPGAQYAFVETDSTTVTFVTGLHVGASVKFTTSAINAASYGDAFQISYTPPFTGSVATNVGDKIAQTVSAMDFGAVGDGVADDQAAIQLAINSGQTIIDLAGATYAVNTKLIFNQAGQTFRNGTLLFNGANTERLANITANNVTFDNVVFHGNEKQPSSALIWVADNVQRPRFISCIFKKLTGRAWGTNVLNQMYAVLISPYGVLNFEFRDCLFQDLLKYNDGTGMVPPTTAFVGGGFVGGVCFLPEDLNPGSTAQTVVTQGTIEGCTFDNIQTIRAAGLSINDQIEFNDADAIRTYGDANTPELFVHVSDCVFKRVSKRCFKFRASGSTAYDNECYATDLPYQMVTAVDLTSNSKCVNLKVHASAALPVYNGVQWAQGPNFNRESLVEGLYVSHALYGVSFFSDPGFGVMRNLTLRNSYFNQVYDAGVISVAPIATDYENIVIDNVQIFGGANDTIGMQTFGGSGSQSSGITLRNSFFSNCNINLAGVDNIVENVTVEISSNTWVGATASTQVFRIGQENVGGFQNVDGLFINAYNLSTSFISVTRQNLGLLIGDNAVFRNVRLTVPQGLSQSYPHVDIYGREITVDGFNYDGPGAIYVGTLVKAERTTIKNAVRMSSNGSATTVPFFYSSNASTTQVTFQNIVDFRDPGGSTPSIQIAAGTEFAAIDVVSKATAAQVVTTGGFVATVGCTRFATPTQAYALTNVTTNRAFDANTVTTADLADVVGTLIEDLRDRLIVRF